MRSRGDLELVRYIVSTCTSALLRLERERKLMGRSDGEVVSRTVEGACHLVLAHITRPIGEGSGAWTARSVLNLGGRLPYPSPGLRPPDRPA